MEKFDLVVIGSGPAGYAAAMRALDFEKSVCLIEGNHLGGTGIINGALTSKTMCELSKDYSVAASIDRGYRASGLIVDYNKVRKSVLNAAKYKQYQLLSQIETFSSLKSEKGNLTLKRGFGKFVNHNTIEITNQKYRPIINLLKLCTLFYIFNLCHSFTIKSKPLVSLLLTIIILLKQI